VCVSCAGEEWPRGQSSALHICTEVMSPGAWHRAFNAVDWSDRFSQVRKQPFFSPLFALLSICHVLKMIALPRQARDKHIEGNALNKREAVFSQPTVEGVDFPTLGISAARNDLSTGELLVKTYAAAPSCAGQATSFKLTTLGGCDLASLTQGGR
jgi:hypothetical protein